MAQPDEQEETQEEQWTGGDAERHGRARRRRVGSRTEVRSTTIMHGGSDLNPWPERGEDAAARPVTSPEAGG
jgi:hypothetical protein